MGTKPTGFDGYAFTISFKGVLLEGLEVAFIALTFGANQHRVAQFAGAPGVSDCDWPALCRHGRERLCQPAIG